MMPIAGGDNDDQGSPKRVIEIYNDIYDVRPRTSALKF